MYSHFLGNSCLKKANPDSMLGLTFAAFSTSVQSVIAKGTMKKFECDCGEIYKSKGWEEHVTHHEIKRNPELPIQ